MDRFYDRAGKPISMDEWSKLFRDNSVLATEIDGLALGPVVIRKPRRVSTVYLGLNHQWGNGPPLIFETMVFPDEDQWRFSTEEEARAHHAQIVRFCERWWWTRPFADLFGSARGWWIWRRVAQLIARGER